jgi:hypothetical protein
LTDAYAEDNERAVTAARKVHTAAAAQVDDLQHRVAAAELRVDRAQRQADDFTATRARDLLEERAVDARELASRLTRAGHEVVRLHRAYVQMRTDIDALVAAIPGAVVRLDSGPAEHPWEGQLREVERVTRAVPEVPAPLPRWAGIQQREQQDKLSRLSKLRRSKRITAKDQAEIDRISADLGVTQSIVEVPDG